MPILRPRTPPSAPRHVAFLEAMADRAPEELVERLAARLFPDGRAPDPTDTPLPAGVA